MDDTSAASPDGFTDVERDAIKQRAAELRQEARRGTGADKAAADEEDVLGVIAGLPQPDRAIAEHIHAAVAVQAPGLSPKLWYGMPAYARDGKIVCFFVSAQKEKARYSSLGFNPEANLDEGAMWPTAFAITELTEAGAAAISALIRKAAG
ncbi:iron chaperone [Nonomuraea typhae]|uniref:Iron chaperone n=1 Tax=Nonomuraea typhae TaxID=2603600 RepID=A0ABW7Z770_9ACTN